MVKDEKKRLLTDILRADGSIIVNKKLARNIGMEAAVMFSEIVSKQHYFTERGQLTDDGFFFNTVADMERDTTLTDHKQRKAIKLLSALELIEHKNRDMPQKRYFKVTVNEETLINVLESQEIQQFLKNLRINSQKIKDLILKKFKGNNTNTPNNTNPTIRSTGSSPPETPRSISFKDFFSNWEVSEDIEMAITYFLNQYESQIGKSHVNMKPETWQQVVDTILYVEDERLNKAMDIDAESIENMTDHYFKKISLEKYKVKNICITHFNNPKIKKVNFYESAY